MKPQHQRYPYSAIVDRPSFDWPDGRRVAIYIGVNHEVFHFGEGLGATLAPSQTEPDVMNYAWRDYGNRVGAWRMFDLFDELDLKATALVNAELVERCPRLVEACRDRGDEIAAHGMTNAEAQGAMDETAERAMIERTTQALASMGARPRGWLGPWISQSEHTPDLLAEAGYDYLLDWAHDDQPVWFQTRSRPILSVPYSQEINNIPAIVARQQEAEGFATMIERAVEQLLIDGRKHPVALGIALHPYVMGQAHRLPALREVLNRLREKTDEGIWWTTAGQIAEHYRGIESANDTHR